MSPAIITLIILGIMVIFFVNDKLPAGLVAMLGAGILTVMGIIEPASMFTAFAGSTIVLITAMMVIGSALFHTGIAAKMADVLVKVTGTSENGIMIAFMLVSAIVSAFASGIAVVAMLLPIVIGVSQKAGVSVSRQLIPMSFAASVGCNLSLMGAASNVVVNGQLEELGFTPLGFFEISKVGIPTCIISIIFFLTIGKRFLTPGDSSDKEYLAEYTGSAETIKFDPVRSVICLTTLAIVIIAMAIGSDRFPMYLIATIGALVMVLTGCIGEKEAFKAIDLSTIFIVAGMSAVSTAMNESGGAALISNTAIKLLGEHPSKMIVLFVILVLVVLLTNAMMNTSTALLVTPLLLPIATAFDMNTQAVAIAICVAASAPFLTPVGSGTNTLIIKPGNLKFMDFFRPGIGLTVLILIVSMVFIPIFWPL